MKAKFLLFLKKTFRLWNVGLLLVLFCMNLQGQITQVGTATTATSVDWGSPALTIPKPTGISVGDIMIANISQATDWLSNPLVSNGTPTLENWIQIATNNNLGFANIARGTVLHKIADATDASSEITSYTFTLGANHKAAGAIVAFTGINKDVPFTTQEIGTMQVTQMNNSVSCPEITTSANNTMIIMFAMDWALCGTRNFGSWATAINPNPLIENYDYNSTTTAIVHVGAAWALKENAGPTGIGTLSNTSSTGNGCDAASRTTVAILLALRPEKSVSITGPTNFCAGSSTTLLPTSGGTWESSNLSVASVTNTGVVTGLAACTASFTFIADEGTWSATTGAVTVNPSITPAVTITSSDADNAICDGTRVTFTATPTNTGGGTVSYKWFYLGNAYDDWGSSWMSWELEDEETVSCEITVTGGTCLTKTTAVSNEITTSVFNPLDVPSLTITSSDEDNKICYGTPVTFTATPTNTGGGTVSYKWFYLGNAYDDWGSSWTSWELEDGETVSCEITVKNCACFPEATATSNVIEMSVETTPVAGALFMTPEPLTVCEGTAVSAVLTAGSGGNGTDELQFSTFDGTDWSEWAAYTSGTDISTTGKSGVEIRTRRLASCYASSDYNTVTWEVEATPIAGTFAKTPDMPTVCEGTNVSAVLTTGTGGDGTEMLIFRTNDGSDWSIFESYTSGAIIGTTGKTAVEVWTCRWGNYCSPSDENIVSWTVEKNPLVKVEPTSYTIHKGESTTLTASGAVTYTWSPADGLNTTTGATVIATPVNTTIYTVTGYTGECSNTASAIITVKQWCGNFNDEYESNNTMGTAKTILVDNQIYANLLNTKDQDWYSFQTESDGSYTINFVGKANVDLINSRGQKLRAVGRTTPNTYALTGDTWYYVKVSGSGSKSYLCYTLKIVFDGSLLGPIVEAFDELKSAKIEPIPDGIIKIWPNPTKNEFELYNGTENPVKVRIMDVIGRTVENVENVGITETVVFGDGYKPGVYFVQTFVNGSPKVFKLVKQ